MIKNWRFWTGIGVGAVIALLAVTTVSLALAQEPGPNTPTDTCPGFVDADSDGICDNFADEDGDGVCDFFGNGWGNGCGRNFAGQDSDEITCDNFADEDGDGVCDSYDTDTRMGYGRGLLRVNPDQATDLGRGGFRGQGSTRHCGRWQ